MVAKSRLSVFFFSLFVAGNVVFAQLVYAQEAGNGVAAAGSATPGTTIQGPIPIGGPWTEFGFGAAGSFAEGCLPADPAGFSCVPSSGGNSAFGDAPPWTFTAPPGGATLTVTDAFLSGDRFEIFDSGASIGTTSAVGTGGNCGDNPDPCLVDPLVSHGVFPLGPGPHAITIQAIASPFNAGAAYFRIDDADRKDHFLCYKVVNRGKFKKRRVLIGNQFEERRYTVIGPDTLCVPSTKVEID